MRFAATPFILSIALMSAPAFAQSGMNNGPDQGNTSSQYGQSTDQYNSNNLRRGLDSNQANENPGAVNRQSNRFANNNGNRENNPGVTSDTQQRIQQSLEQNGFRNVQVTPEAFLIRAQAPDGSRIVMEVSPDQAAGVIEHTGSSNTNRNQGINQSGSSSQPWNSNSDATTNNNGTSGNGMNR